MICCKPRPLSCEAGLQACDCPLVFLHQFLQLILKLRHLISRVRFEQTDLVMKGFDLVLEALDVSF